MSCPSTGTEGRTMKTRAAILWEQNTDWSVEEIDLDPPQAGEVLVKLVGSGLCHSDEHIRTGDMVVPQETADLLGLQQFPIIGRSEEHTSELQSRENLV